MRCVHSDNVGDLSSARNINSDKVGDLVPARCLNSDKVGDLVPARSMISAFDILFIKIYKKSKLM